MLSHNYIASLYGRGSLPPAWQVYGGTERRSLVHANRQQSTNVASGTEMNRNRSGPVERDALHRHQKFRSAPPMHPRDAPAGAWFP